MKRWLPWAVLIVVATGALWWGSPADDGPPDDAERVHALASQLACPTCDGQSLVESDAPAAVALRNEIERRVAAGQSDEEILAYAVSRYVDPILLNPPRSGVAGLVWVLPVAFLVVAGGGMAVAFWRRRSRSRPGLDATEGEEGRDGEEGMMLPAAPARTGRGRAWLVGTGVTGLALVAGLAMANASGSRRPGEVVTGDIRASISGKLAEAAELAVGGEPVDALELYDDVLAEDPRNFEALSERGLLLASLGFTIESEAMIDEAIASVEKALEVQPGQPRALFYMGLALRLSGDDERGNQFLLDALAADPPPPLRLQIEDFIASAGGDTTG